MDVTWTLNAPLQERPKGAVEPKGWTDVKTLAKLHQKYSPDQACNVLVTTMQRPCSVRV